MVLELTQTASMVSNNLEVPYELNCGAIVKLQKKETSLDMIIGQGYFLDNY